MGGLTLSSTGIAGDGAGSSHVLLGYKTIDDKIARENLKGKKKY